MNRLKSAGLVAANLDFCVLGRCLKELHTLACDKTFTQRQLSRRNLTPGVAASFRCHVFAAVGYVIQHSQTNETAGLARRTNIATGISAYSHRLQDFCLLGIKHRFPPTDETFKSGLLNQVIRIKAQGSAMDKLTPRLSLNLERTFGLDVARSADRVHSAKRHFHVVLSGNRRKVLFATVDDRRALNAIAFEVLQRFDATLHAYCLMPNHFRALVQIDDRLLVKALRRIATRYSHHRQRHLKSELKPGPHLFERPYSAQRVDTDGDFLHLLRNIHLAPVIANKVIAPDDYLWSSHRAYLGYRSVAKITTEFGLSLLAAEPSHARVAYHQFIAAGLAENVTRTIKQRLPLARHTESDHDAASGSIAPVVTAPEPVEPNVSPPKKEQSVLSRLGRNRKNLLSRRFMSIY